MLQADVDDERLEPLDPYDIVPDDRKYWHYTGSLTTPPCQPRVNGSVEWFVMQTPDSVKASDLFLFTSYFAKLDKVRPASSGCQSLLPSRGWSG